MIRLLPAVLALGLAACERDTPEPPPVLRPVLSTVVQPRQARPAGFSGSVEARYRVTLGFRVLGRLVARTVEVGDTVTKGEQIAAIDPVALQLAVRSATADLASAQAQLANAAAEEKRQNTLLGQNVSSQAQYDTAKQAQDTAGATLQRNEANLAKAREQLGYAQLHSDMDGVVTAVSAQVGQTVSPGQAIVTVARPDVREAVVDLPGDLAGTLKPGAAFDVALLLDPSLRVAGTVREIAPEADAATRTRRVTITLADPPPVFRLGTTIVATPRAAPAPATLVLPASALLEQGGQTFVWVVDVGAGTVARRPVAVARRGTDTVEIADGLAPGTRVVTAGVHSLKPGQTIKVAQEASP